MVQVGVARDQRTRPSMEDRCATAVIGDATLVAVFDGHGGSRVAEHAVRHVVDLVTAALTEGVTDDALWRSVFAGLDVDRQDVGSTATLVLVRDARISAGWVGDSRAVLVTADGWRLLTRDHRIDRADELGRCVAAGAIVAAPYVVDPVTSNGLMVTRSLGDRGLRAIGVISEPEIVSVPRTPADVGIVATTDGLRDVVSNDEAAAVGRKHPPASAAERLVESVVARGGTDNVTVAVARF